VGVLEKNVSVGFEATICSQVRAALHPLGAAAPGVAGFTGGLGGRDIPAAELKAVFLGLLAHGGTHDNAVGWVDPGVRNA